MARTDSVVSVKQVGANGQISLGKKYAGRHVVIEDLGEGTWLVRTASVVPDSERWLHDPEARRTLDRAMERAATQPARYDNADDILARLEDASK